MSSSSSNMKSQMRQCACIKCKGLQNEILVYEEAEVSHILYAILTIIFFPLAIFWYLKIQKVKHDTQNNINLAASSRKCEECDGNLMVLSH